MSQPADTLVLVTGGTGYISSWTIKYLLEEGYKVRATVRDPKSSKCDFLKQLPGADVRLELVAADLLSSKGWDEAVKDATYVLHIASPYSLKVKNPQKDLVDPAVNGTLNVLKACKDAPSVKRVVLTSSVAAVSDCFDEWKTHTYGPDDWNTTSTLKRNPYYFSKVLAEKAAVDFVSKESPGFDLVRINPYVVYGPSLEANGSVNTSVTMVETMVKGESPMNIPLSIGIVDVRDVALAHVRAMTNPDASGKRFLLWAGSLQQYELSALVQKFVPDKLKRKIPTSPPSKLLPKGLVVTLMRFQESRDVASYIKTNWGKSPKFDTSLATDVLGIKFMNLEDTVHDTVDWLLARKA